MISLKGILSQEHQRSPKGLMISLKGILIVGAVHWLALRVTINIILGERNKTYNKYIYDNLEQDTTDGFEWF